MLIIDALRTARKNHSLGRKIFFLIPVLGRRDQFGVNPLFTQSSGDEKIKLGTVVKNNYFRNSGHERGFEEGEMLPTSDSCIREICLGLGDRIINLLESDTGSGVQRPIKGGTPAKDQGPKHGKLNTEGQSMPVSTQARTALPDLSYIVPEHIKPKAGLPKGLAPPSVRERTLFFRSFACLFQSGVPIVRSLEILGEQTREPAFRLLLHSMAKDLIHGHSLTAVFSRVPEVFTSYHVRMIRVGEMSGRMDEALEQLALSEERTGALNMKLKSALTYPAWTMLIATAFLLFVPPYLMDGLFDAIEVTGAEMPLITIVVQGIFTVVRHPVFQLAFASGCGALIYNYPKIVRSEKVKSWILTSALKLKPSRKLAESLITARFARAFSTMLEAGVPPALSLRLAGEEVGTLDYKQAGVEALYRLENGEEFPRAVRRIPHLRGYFHEFLKAGEETGTMPDMSSRAADIAESEVEHQLSLFVALLEPVVMLFIGVVVGILVVASMLPMVSVLQTL
jgi:type IV pilus assembly protein PilC